MRVFKLKLPDADVPLEWGTWAMHRFCQLNGNGKPMPLSGLLAIYDSETFTFSHVITMIQAAAESANEGLIVTERQASKWIDEGGGLSDPKSQIVAFIKFTTGEQVPDITERESDEKKSQSIEHGMTS